MCRSRSARFTTGSNGSFIFTNLVPGEYKLSIGVPGFKTYQQTGITLGAQERVDLHEILLTWVR
jgi:Cna protein B-type domain.